MDLGVMTHRVPFLEPNGVPFWVVEQWDPEYTMLYPREESQSPVEGTICTPKYRAGSRALMDRRFGGRQRGDSQRSF